jgi:hypothetical protein
VERRPRLRLKRPLPLPPKRRPLPAKRRLTFLPDLP